MDREPHPSIIPIKNVFKVNTEKEALEAANKMVELGFSFAYKVIMPKQEKLAKRIGYTVTTNVNYGLSKAKKPRDVRYWTYHEDKEHFAIVFTSSEMAEKFGL